jgi:hypothetical protein
MAKAMGCETCRLKAYAERKPRSIIARIWRWHTGWCPGWKAYQKALAEQASNPQEGATDPGGESVT